jgi:hypothetical protein
MNKQNKLKMDYPVNNPLPSLAEETVWPYYQRGGLAHAIALLGLSEPDSELETPTE